MHVAFISYEYPPETPNGGIATYVQQAARMMALRGYAVDVFAGSPTRDAVLEVDGVRVHRVYVAQRPDFATRVAPVFAQCHQATPFDVMEGPDYDADARFAAELVPHVPLIVRLHTPRYLAATLNNPVNVEAAPREDRKQKTEDAPNVEMASEEKTHAIALPVPDYDYREDYAYKHALRADMITAPSRSIRDIVARDWHLPAERIRVFPNVFQPSPALLALPLAPHSRIVTYFGRLEQRKGVITLARAIPEILRHHPDVHFRFVGRTLESPEPGVTMRDYLSRLLAPHADSVTISGHISLESIPELLADTSICVFPSRWENYPGVCLEAMAAGRAIVGSEAGGMADMLQDHSGVLIPPENPKRLADAVSDLLSHPEQCERIGRSARERVQSLVSPAHVAPLQEASYFAAIAQKRNGIR